MSEGDEKRSAWGYVIMGGVLMLLLFVLYVLSSGPAVGLHWRGYLPAGFLRIYVPLQWAAEASMPLYDFLTWYKNLFRPVPDLIY